LEQENQKEVVFVKKNGITKQMKICNDRNKAKEFEIKQVLKKDNCLDLFKDIVIDGEPMAFKDKDH